MTRHPPLRLLAAGAMFALSFALIYLANRLAADVRHSLAIFCAVLAFICFGVGLCLISLRLGNLFGRLIMEIVDFFS